MRTGLEELEVEPYIFQRILLCDEKSLAEFDHLLRTSPDVQGYVRELTLRGRVPSRDDLDPVTAWSLKAPLLLASMLPVLHTLRLHGLFYEEGPDLDFLEGLALLTSVRRLELLRCGYICDEAFVFLCAHLFPKLRHIEITASDLLHFDEDTTASHHFEGYDTLQLSSLRISNSSDWQTTFLEWLRVSPFRATLRALRVDLWISSLHLADILDGIGHSLQDLDLALPWTVGVVAPYTQALINESNGLLKACTALRYLTLRCFDKSALPYISVLIDNVPINHLVHLTIAFTQDGEEWRMPSLAALGASLANPRLACLSAIRFAYLGPLMQDIVLEALSKDLPPAVMSRVIFTHKIRHFCMHCSECPLPCVRIFAEHIFLQRGHRRRSRFLLPSVVEHSCEKQFQFLLESSTASAEHFL